MYWENNLNFLNMLISQNMDASFVKWNRHFFVDTVGGYSDGITASQELTPFVRVCLSGVTYELLRLWVTTEQGLSVQELSTLAENMLSGRIFTDKI